MITEEVIERVRMFAEDQMAGSGDSSHNIDHVYRVRRLALRIAEGEDVDLGVIEIAALLHDIGSGKERNDDTGKVDHAVESALLAGPFLEEIGLSRDEVSHVVECIVAHRYRSENRPETLEAKIVFDADKLETVGAIGIARAFAWIGKNDAYIYRKVDIEEYARENLNGAINGRIHDTTKHSPQINWETKDKHLLAYLYTKKAREIASERSKFSEDFFAKLEREIQGLE
jgi:uncharacterized protein